MPLLKPSTKTKKKQIRISIEDDLLNEIQAYCKWSGIRDESEFIEQAANFILSKDKEWKKNETKGSY